MTSYRARILIAEDEDGIRNSVERLLRLEGYEVIACANGQVALAQAELHLPQVLVTDIHMPEMDGFALLDAIRARSALADCSVIMLTAAEDRANMRRGMTTGADDYITKPFRREELLDSICAQLKKREQVRAVLEEASAKARGEVETRLRREFVAQLSAGASQLSKLASTAVEVPIDTQSAPESLMPGEVSLQEASVLFSDIRNFTTAAEKLAVTEVAHILAAYFERACDCVQRHGGHHLKVMGDGLMVVFDDASLKLNTLPHARRAVLAGIDLAVAAAEFQDWLNTWYHDRGLPPFAIGVGIHTGEVMFGRLGSRTNSEITPLGDAVNTAARLETLSKKLGWTLVVSAYALSAAGSGFEIGGRQTVPVKGRSATVSVCEVLGVQSRGVVDIALDEPDAIEEENIRQAIRRNSEITARAVKGALNESLTDLVVAPVASGPPKRFKTYQVLHKIGQGGMSEVYLAQDERRTGFMVLKLMRMHAQVEMSMLRRFIQEYAVLSDMDHPNIARIYDQGFTDDFAYIGMEYLEGGSLHSRMQAGLAATQVLAVMRQVASALGALHAKALVHRDLKPENLMYRATGELVLADFGVVKRLNVQSDELVRTRHGEIIGTPYYLSPEQATNRDITPQTDFYSLGVMLYEMLTGRRPYTADSVEILIARHLYADVPVLPAEHVTYQSILSRLMAKQPQDRFQTAQMLLDALDALSP
jgi:serine/threonine-protein kinase PpkA